MVGGCIGECEGERRTAARQAHPVLPLHDIINNRLGQHFSEPEANNVVEGGGEDEACVCVCVWGGGGGGMGMNHHTSGSVMAKQERVVPWSRGCSHWACCWGDPYMLSTSMFPVSGAGERRSMQRGWKQQEATRGLWTWVADASGARRDRQQVRV